MEFRTIVPLPTDGPTITPATHALVLGSCFAEHVGSRLAEALGTDQCCVNPFGVLYNPMSIAQALEVILGAPEKPESPESPESPETPEHPEKPGHPEHPGHPENPEDLPIFLGRDGLWHSWLHSTHYSGTSREECLQRCTASLAEARRVFAKTDLLIVTFGTSRCYQLNAPSAEPSTGTTDRPSDFVVANCHKELATRFTERDCTVEEIVATWRPLLAKLQRLRPTLQVVFTISPYRYRKYGYHASQLAKARLLLAAEELTSSLLPSPSSLLPPTSSLSYYFPSYEILLDELRDYRFYKPDMLHPSDQAVDYIWERFREWTFTPEMDTLYQQRIKELKHTHHHANH